MSTNTTSSADTLLEQRGRRTERLIIPAGFITTAGNTFQLTASSILVFRAGHTALAVGWLFIVVAIPQVLLSVLFGHLVDRVDRRTLCIAADLVSAAAAFALSVSAAGGEGIGNPRSQRRLTRRATDRGGGPRWSKL